MQEAAAEETTPLPSILPDQLPLARRLDPAATLAFRTPVQEHPLSADSKAAAILTLLGLMFTILGRSAAEIAAIIGQGPWKKAAMLGLLGAFVLLAFAAVVQAFRTISPRFPKAPPSLAFFGDIARLKREAYIASVESLTPEQAVEQVLFYNHTVSVITVEKFRQLRFALRWFQSASVVWFALMLLIIWRLVS